MLLTETISLLGLPLAAVALGSAAYVVWVVPLNARQLLRATVERLELEVDTDERLLRLPPSSRPVGLFRAILRAVAEQPDAWVRQLIDETPAIERGNEPTAEQRQRLAQHAERLERALAAYEHSCRWLRIARPEVGVAEVVADEEFADRLVGQTQPLTVIDLSRHEAENAVGVSF